MLFIPDHGAGPLADPLICGFSHERENALDEMPAGYGSLFEAAQTLPPARYGALADAMAQPARTGATGSAVAPVFTYLAAFVAHDLSAPGAEGRNLRSGALRLEAVHGGGPVQGPFARRFDGALRCPENPAMLRAGGLSPSPHDPVPIPNDPSDRCRDVLRVGALATEDLGDLPALLQALFAQTDGRLNPARALIADPRNDCSLALSQLHLAFVRLHNQIIRHAPQHRDAPLDDPEALFHWGRQQGVWIYQWLVINALLAAICDPDVLAQVHGRGPVLYARFRKRMAHPHPLPQEFTLAAFQLLPSMQRRAYDWSFQFGRPQGEGIAGQADHAFLQRMTGRGGFDGAASLPGHCSIEWARFVHPPAADKPERAARPITTRLAACDAGLAQRLFEAGAAAQLPSAQICLAQLDQMHGLRLPQLTPAQLSTCATGRAVVEGGFYKNTPLWFYILKEAELLGQQGRLGPLGSLLVADTLIGVIAYDCDSYWNKGAQPGTWHPREGVRPDGITIDSMAAMMNAARLL